MHALKFQGVSALAPVMSAPMVGVLESWSPPVDAIVPVPLGGMRKRVRGYNQAELLAGELSRTTQIPMNGRLLRRKRPTPPQVHQTDALGRRRNVKDAFEVRGTAGGAVLLVDDVTTTGATLDACARALLEAGAEAVFCLTFARED